VQIKIGFYIYTSVQHSLSTRKAIRLANASPPVGSRWTSLFMSCKDPLC